MTLNDASQPNYMTNNLTAFSQEAARIDPATGMPLLLAKATNSVGHGGGQRFAVDSTTYTAFSNFISAEKFDDQCDLQLTPQILTSLVQLTPAATLRKASLQLAARLPTTSEVQLASNGQLDAALDSLLADPNFGNFVFRAYDDVIHSMGECIGNVGIDFYAGATPNQYWYEDANNTAGLPAGMNNQYPELLGFCTTGLQLAKYLVTQGKDFRDIIDANYLMMNPWSARGFSPDGSFSLFHSTPWKNPLDPNEWEPVFIDYESLPTAGLLTDAMFLYNYQTTSTNRNRKRALYIYRWWLGQDVLSYGQQPPNLTTILADAASNPNASPPFVSNSACVSCHSLVDPIGHAMNGYGLWAKWEPDIYGNYNTWAPGFEETMMPAGTSNPMQWLAHQITSDPRFARAAVRSWYTFLTDAQPMGDMPSVTANKLAYLAGQQHQDAVFTSITQRFVASNYNIKEAIKGIIESEYYRGLDVQPNAPQTAVDMLNTIITYRWTGPVLLNNKLLATTQATYYDPAHSCNNNYGQTTALLCEFDSTLGAEDTSNRIFSRNFTSNALMVHLTTQAAASAACYATTKDFAQPSNARTLFTSVEITTTPDTAVGLQAITTAITQIYSQVTGLNATDDPASVSAAVQLFQASYVNNKAARDTSVPSQCQNGSIQSDPNYTIKAWMAALTFILSDPSMVQE